MSDVFAIVGSTRFVDTTAIELAESVIEANLRRNRPDQVISGAAEGIDTLAARIARRMGIDVIEQPPANPRWQPDGYKARNDIIADRCTRLMRIVCRWSTTYGSGYTLDRAAGRGKPTMSLRLPTYVHHGTLSATYGRITMALTVADGIVTGGNDYARTLGWLGRDADQLISSLVHRKIPLAWTPNYEESTLTERRPTDLVAGA